ncbi:MAG TPA: hypothetical protein VNF06_03530 [Candidatus Aquilonibacter sp.]|nr:hypothetical protein [Candidatus Aquilonibacter sp.]
MFETKGPANGPKQIKSALNLIARNTLDKENFVMFERKRNYVPFDSRFYDAFASFVIYNSLVLGSSNQLKTYLSNGYNRDIRIVTEDKTKHTIAGFVLHSYRTAGRDVIKRGLEPAMKYIQNHKRIPLSASNYPEFRVLKNDKSGKDLILLTSYRAEEYSCNMNFRGGHWSIQEFCSSLRSV